MAVNLIAKATITIEAPATRVWKALTTPELIREYFRGTHAVSDWKEGSELHFKGEWEGKEYHNKGTILKVQPEKLFQYTNLSSLSSQEDSPENYSNITYELTEEGDITTLLVRQENLPDVKTRNQAEQKWRQVLNDLKQVVEHDKAVVQH